jgi:hypothetical protein
MQGSGGVKTSGGAQGSGGAKAGGGTLSSGGVPGTGGATVSGGAKATGGTLANGGAGGSSSTKADAAADGPQVDAPLTGGSDAADALATVADARTQGPRPDASPDSCGAWAMTEGVCCAQYCTDDNKSESCDKCGGPGAAKCEVVNAKACTSGQWPEVHSVTDNEDWHYSRSTHFGTAPNGACAFGLYGICSTAMKFADTAMQTKCDAFCKLYPDLCKDPSNVTLRGNFAAPQGNYYTQFWSSLPGDLDNYLSCGECFELIHTQNDGSEYQSSASSYTPPIVLQVADSVRARPIPSGVVAPVGITVARSRDFLPTAASSRLRLHPRRSITIRCRMRVSTSICQTSPWRACRPATPTAPLPTA